MAITWTNPRADRRSARRTSAIVSGSLARRSRRNESAAVRVCAWLALAASAANAQVNIVPPPPPLESPSTQQAEAQLARSQQQTQRRPLTIVPSITVEETITDNV